MPGETLISDFRQGRARHRREPVIADIEIVERSFQRLDQFGVAMAEIIGAAVQVQVNQAAARHVMKEIALAPVDDEVDAGLLPELGLVRDSRSGSISRSPRLSIETGNHQNQTSVAPPGRFSISSMHRSNAMVYDRRQHLASQKVISCRLKLKFSSKRNILLVSPFIGRRRKTACSGLICSMHHFIFTILVLEKQACIICHLPSRLAHS